MHNQNRQYYVYIVTNAKRTLYIGVTNDLHRRVYEHRQKLIEGFTKKYNVGWLVYYEVTTDASVALERESNSRSGDERRRSR